MLILDIDTKQKYDIDLQKQSGEEHMKCPKCSHTRKKQKQKVFSYNHIKETGFCHHCNSSFVRFKEFQPLKAYTKPKFNNQTELSESVVKWFASRGISQKTLIDWKITQGLEWMPQVGKEVNTIQFNYFRDDELINIKYRDGAKNFKLSKDAELIPYGLDMLDDSNYIVIVEGEMDALSFYEGGIKSVISVPNGAKQGNNNLEYLDACISLFDKYERIILAVDNDLAGVGLRNDLAVRLGVEKCYKFAFRDTKDANEYAIKYGASVLKVGIDDAVPFPIEGVYSANDISDEIDNLYKFGLQKGYLINDIENDKYISFDFGRLYTVTGIPGHGKSEVVDWWVTMLNILHGFKAAYFSPENHPLELHLSKLFSKITGKKFDKQYLKWDEYQQCKEYIADNYYFINPEDDYTVDTILARARQLVYQKGIKILVIDPYNKLEHKQPKGMSETNYISMFLDKMTNFAKRNNVMVFLVAHPRKMQKRADSSYEVPTLYDINGSSNFYNKTDFGITVYRDFNNPKIEVHFQKIKFKHLGEVGLMEKKYNYNNGRFEKMESDVNAWDYSNYLNTPLNEDIQNKYIEPVIDNKIEPNFNWDDIGINDDLPMQI
jgi:twinkle protein